MFGPWVVVGVVESLFKYSEGMVYFFAFYIYKFNDLNILFNAILDSLAPGWCFIGFINETFLFMNLYSLFFGIFGILEIKLNELFFYFFYSTRNNEFRVIFENRDNLVLLFEFYYKN